MFHNLVTLSTMTSVVLHALMGCCVHHAHAGHTHSHDVDQVMVDIPHVVGLNEAGHDHDGQSDEGHKASCQHQHNADGSNVVDCFDSETIKVCSEQPCSESPCSGSHGPHESCDEADCNIVTEQRSNDIELVSMVVWSSLLTDSLLLSSRDVFALRQQVGPPPDPHPVVQPLRVQTQVWRL